MGKRNYTKGTVKSRRASDSQREGFHKHQPVPPDQAAEWEGNISFFSLWPKASQHSCRRTTLSTLQCRRQGKGVSQDAWKYIQQLEQLRKNTINGFNSIALPGKSSSRGLLPNLMWLVSIYEVRPAPPEGYWEKWGSEGRTNERTSKSSPELLKKQSLAVSEEEGDCVGCEVTHPGLTSLSWSSLRGGCVVIKVRNTRWDRVAQLMMICCVGGARWSSPNPTPTPPKMTSPTTPVFQGPLQLVLLSSH